MLRTTQISFTKHPKKRKEKKRKEKKRKSWYLMKIEAATWYTIRRRVRMLGKEENKRGWNERGKRKRE